MNGVGRQHDRIVGRLWPRGMAAGADDGDLKFIGRRHQRAGPAGDDAKILRGVDMDAKDGVNALQGALLYHADAAGLALVVGGFFAGLEEQAHGAGQAALVGQLLEQGRRAHQHRRVRIMPAGVHNTGPLTVETAAVLFLDRQGVHIGAQPHQRPVVAADMADDTGLGHLRLRLDPQVQHRFVDKAGGAMFGEGQLRVLVNCAAPRADPGQDGFGARIQFGARNG